MKNFPIENREREEGKLEKVLIQDFAEKCNLQCYYGEANEAITFSTVSVNRPGLYITGSDDYFAPSRVQVIGNAEMHYLYNLNQEKRRILYDEFFSRKFPCLILSRGLKPSDDMLLSAKKYSVPIFTSVKITSEVVNDVIVYLNRLLAQSISMHGVLVNVNGMGILIIGDSGIGKSETALELIHRGHRLISDDSVVIKRVGNDLVGLSPEVTQGFMEIRGVGIINIERIFGIGSIQISKKIELVIELEKWQENKNYDRVGKSVENIELLGMKIPKIIIPVTAGRNLAVVVEVAAGNHRLRQSGYIAADEIDDRINSSADL